MSTCTGIDSNLDISGIGIRVNLYMSMLLVAIIPEKVQTIRLLNVVVTNAGISGLALLITAMVQTAKHSLTFYHAIFIIHILAFTGVLVTPTGNYKGNTQTRLLRTIISFLMAYGGVLLFSCYGFYIWTNSPTFGQNSECNDQINYIVFFVSVRATVGWLRKLWMVIFGITIAILTLIPLAVCLTIAFKACRSPDVSGNSDRDGGGWNANASTSVTFWNSCCSITTTLAKPLAAIYGVVMLELYEKRNQHLLIPGENDFTFGQILALVQIVTVLNEVFLFLLGGCTGEEGESIGSHPQQPKSAPSRNVANGNGSSEIQLNVATTGTGGNKPVNNV